MYYTIALKLVHVPCDCAKYKMGETAAERVWAFIAEHRPVIA
jgi:hypothetical protein